MTKPIEDITPAEMDDWLSNAWRTMKATEQEAEAKAFYRAGEFVRELGRRLDEADAKLLAGIDTNWMKDQGNE